MRERLALAVLAVTLALLVGLAAVFAFRHNKSESPALPPPITATAEPATPPPVAPAPAPAVEEQGPSLALKNRGAQLFAEQRCATCHAVAGSGNPRYPLDGVGGRLDEQTLLHGVVGTGEIAGRLSPVIVRRKERYRTLPEDDLTALVSYLQQLR